MTDNKYGTVAVQEKLLKMMKDFHNFCASNGLQYSLNGGSVLGAVRHDGFIPWDDDIDVMMTRDYFEQLLRIKDSFEGYSIQCNDLWVYRIKPVDLKDKSTIDIFIMDNVPDNAFISKLKIMLIKTLQGMMKDKPNYKKYGVANRILLFVTYNIGRLFTHERKLRMYAKCSQIGNSQKTKYVNAYNDLYRLLDARFEGSTMEKLLLHKFEDAFFYIPENYDDYLTKQYGDYMVLPPENERIPKHI